MLRSTKKLLVRTLSVLSPTMTSKILFKKRFGRKLNLNSPETLNEKLMWLKLNTYKNNPLVTTCVDKYKVREYLKDMKCENILNELIGVWNNVEEINWDNLPNKFVLKCNHGAGYNIVCHDKNHFNMEEAFNKLSKWLKEDYWKILAEINYKYVPKKIICEKFIETKTGELPNDYKVYCFNGEAKYIMLCIGREKGKPEFYYYDKKWNLMPFTREALNNPNFKLEKPKGIEEIFQYAEKLSKPFPFVRADFYLENEQIIFGELTFTPSGGLDVDRLSDVDKMFGKEIVLP